MSRCWRVTSWVLSEYADGMLPERKKAWVEEHLSACAACAEELKQLQELKAQLHELPAVKLSSDFDVNFKSALLVARQEKIAAQRAAEPAPKRRFVYVGIPRPVQVFAVALLSITVALGVYSLMRPAPSAFLVAAAGSVEIRHGMQTAWSAVQGKVEIAAGDEVRTGPGGEATILAGKIYQGKLMENSTWVGLELATSAKQRNANFVLKEGTLMVKTGSAFRGRTMRIEGPSGRANVVGTSFMMQALPKGETVLSVVEGKVDMTGKRINDPSKVAVDRLESAKVLTKGSPQMPRPMNAQEWGALAGFDERIGSHPAAKKLIDLANRREKPGSQEIKDWQTVLMAEADRELGSFGMYLLGSKLDEVLAPAEALQQYVSVLTHFPEVAESAWAAEFLRTKLDLVPSDLDALGEEIAVAEFEEPLKEAGTVRSLTPEFLRGMEPQKRFVVTQIEVGEKMEESPYRVERAITFERRLGEKNFLPVGYLDSVSHAKTGEVALRLGKLFTRDEMKRVLEVSTALFHPDGRLIYTVDRHLRYQGTLPTGYVEIYKDSNGEKLATVERKVEQRSTKGLVLRYSETLKNAKGEILLGRNRSGMIYDPKGRLLDYQDELVDIDRRLALERGVEQLKVEFGQERLVKVAETPLMNMDEMMQKMREMHKRSAPYEIEKEMEQEKASHL